MTQFAALHREGMVAQSLALELVVYGMRTDLKRKLFEWYRERLSLPAPLLWKAQFHKSGAGMRVRV